MSAARIGPTHRRQQHSLADRLRRMASTRLPMSHGVTDAAERRFTRHGVCDHSLRQEKATDRSDARQRAVSGIERRTPDDTSVVMD